MKNWLLTGLFFMIVSTVFSQGKVTGTITDGAASLPGANVVIKGSTNATSTDFDGKFTIDSPSSTGELVITFLGFDTKTVKFSVSGGTTNVGNIVLASNSNELAEIVVKSTTVDIAKDRKTPVAVSTIKAAEIQAKLGNQELPEMLKSTPSVYVTKSGGGYGDSRITVRGFSQNNVAVMVNGMPVNDMENGAVYWSNWAGLSDVTSFIQVQRGLGSSKLAIASVGGTMNYVTKASDLKQGGTIGTGFGNDNFFKSNVSYNTGKLDSGFSASVLYSHTQGDGYVDGTQFNGDNYYIALGYTTKDNKHDFQFTVTGAPQWHDQRSTFITIAQYQKYGSISDPNIKYNSDWGYKDGQAFNMVRNYYHKPVTSLNWDYQINETSKLSTVAYASFGRGGGSRGAGGVRGSNYASDAFRTADGLVDYDKIVAWNSGQTININGTNYTRTTNGTSGEFQNGVSTGRTGAGNADSPYVYNSTSGISQISSVNSHNWYGAIVNFNKKFSDNLTWDLGVDVRGYKGLHYQNVNNRLGADSYIDNLDVNNPNRVLYGTYSTYAAWNVFKDTDKEEKINFNNDGDVRWYGGFTQLEYTNDKFTAFVQGALSQQGFKRVDYFKYLSSNPLSSTDYENILGGNVKGGVNYNINEHHNVFVNSGYYSKQPFFNAVYPNNASVVNGNLTNEKIFGIEAGYGLRTKMFSANLNLYRTSWKDRYQRSTDGAADNPGGYYDFAGITEIHSGIEFDATAKVLDNLTLTGMFSIGDWQYEGTSTSNRYDVANNPIGGGTATTLYLDGVRVGDAAQTTAALGATYEILPRFTVDANYTYADKLYAAISPGNFTKEDNRGSLQLPSYGTADAGLSYKLLVGKNKSNSVGFRLNVNNLFDYTYIAEAKTNYFAADYPTQPTYKGISTNNQVYFGFGRTWNFALRYDF